MNKLKLFFLYDNLLFCKGLELSADPGSEMEVTIQEITPLSLNLKELASKEKINSLRANTPFLETEAVPVVVVLETSELENTNILIKVKEIREYSLQAEASLVANTKEEFKTLNELKAHLIKTYQELEVIYDPTPERYVDFIAASTKAQYIYGLLDKINAVTNLPYPPTNFLDQRPWTGVTGYIDEEP